MRGSRKGSAPPELVGWIAEEKKAGIELNYRNWTSQLRGVVVDRLFEEQTGQCVYCGRGIKLEMHERYHVEHFRPRSKYPQLDVKYGNIYLSCGPRNVEQGTVKTCGNGKGNWFEEDCHISPENEACTNRFFYGSSGGIRSDGTPEAIKMIEILNLNDQELIRERAELIEEIDEELNASVRADDLFEHYSRTSNASRVSFANVALRYLQGELAAA